MIKEYRDTSIVIADDGTATVEFMEYEDDKLFYSNVVCFKDEAIARLAIKMFMSEYSGHNIFGDYDF